MKSERIYRVAILFVESIKDRLIAKLHELGIVEIDDSTLQSKYDLSDLYSLFSNIDYELQTVKPGDRVLNIDEIDYNRVMEIAKRLKELYKSKKELIDRQKNLLDRIEDGEVLMSYIYYDKLPKSHKLIAFQVDRRDIDINKYEDAEVYELPNRKYLVIQLLNKDAPLKIPEKADLMYVPETFEELDRMKMEIREINRRLEEIQGEIDKIENDPYLRDVKLSVMVYLDRESVMKKIGKGKGFGIIECYVPERYLNNLKSSLEYSFGKDVEILYEKLEDSPVVYIDNPKAVKEIEKISYSFGGIPSYRDFDPSFLYYLFFPMMFGFIVGDAIYGVLIMILAKILEKKFEGRLLENMAKMWYVGGLWSIVFGIIYNEFAGFQIPQIPTLFHRGDHINEYMIFALVIGYIHLMLSYLLNILKHLDPHPEIGHIMSSLGWMVLLTILMSVVLGLFSDWMLILAAISIIIIIKEEKLTGLIELPSIISAFASYVRLAVLGIVGVVFAQLINSLLNLNFLPSLIFVIIFHLLHLVLIVVEASIQAGRLNLVEFRTRFFKGGGRFLNIFSIKKVRGE